MSLLIVLAALAAGCGGSSLSASSSCKTFVEASPEEQRHAIASLSTQFDTPEYVTPLGSPEVGYYCAGHPTTTLAAFFKHAHASGEAGGSTASTEATPKAGSTSVEGATAVEELLAGIPQNGLVLGQPSAKVTLVEFSDLQCPVCKSYAEEVLPSLIKSDVRSGKAKIEYRNFTIISEQSVPAGAAAIAAGKQGRGWSFLELFYRNQGVEGSGYITGAFLTKLAEGAGVPNVGSWDTARASAQATAKVAATTHEAEKLGFAGTPSFAVEGPGTHGLKVLGTPGTAAKLEQAIDAAN